MKNSKLFQRVLLLIIGVVLMILIMGIFFAGNKKKEAKKVGLIITGSIDEQGWNNAHYQGVRYACDKLGAELLIKEYVPEETSSCTAAVHELVKEGASMIILSSYAYPTLVKELIQSYPDVAFYGISAEYYAENMTSYFGRMYQARYLAGVLAGRMTKSNFIGYVAAMPNDEVNRGINAFTLGVRSVNPEAQVNVIWTYSWDDREKEEAATKRLIEEMNADLITYHQNQHFVAATADAAGVYSIGYNESEEGLSERYLTATVWNWKELYYKIVRELFMGETNSVKRHWFGIETGAVGLGEYSPLVTEELRQELEEAKKLMAENSVFSNVIYDNKGILRCDEGESLSDEILLEKMDWYVEGVVLHE
ncbi:MAG: BMP family ABC transporter substrate-binding protein [Lachnospiraceae bacterium]|nr:BMP family ABC transporter substrate-binding protein [Lachnospiraceae bacterium]MBQ8846928.1 BMP family ABC transporter substrate-binding protein [Lachnospiraceae bacterium]